MTQLLFSKSEASDARDPLSLWWLVNFPRPPLRRLAPRVAAQRNDDDDATLNGARGAAYRS